MLHELIPQFTTARGTVAEWRDLERSYAAFAHFKWMDYEQHVAYEARLEAGHPEMAARAREMKERIRARHLPGTLIEPSPEMPSVWEFDPWVHEVQVRFPDSSVTLATRLRGPYAGQQHRTFVNPESRVQEAIAGPPAGQHWTDSQPRHSRDDFDAYCYGPHPREALALLLPNCFLHGWAADWDGRVAMAALGRPADLVALRRLIPLTDPRILGDAFNPTVFDESEHAAVIIDRERQVILEWRGLWEGEPCERHFFTEIAFDVPIDDAAFYPGRSPDM